MRRVLRDGPAVMGSVAVFYPSAWSSYRYHGHSAKQPEPVPSSSASSSHSAAPSQKRRRVTRRSNYADREAILNDRMAHDGRGAEDDQASLAHAVQQYEKQLRASSATTNASGQVAPSALSDAQQQQQQQQQRITWGECRDRLLLELLQTRRLGVAWVVGRWWRHVMAYAAYVGLGGRIEFYTRRSIAPPPTAEHHDASTQQQQQPPLQEHVAHGLLLKDRAHPAVFIGSSPIHSRGLFTRERLPRGTRILTEPQRSFLLAPSFLRLLADTHEKLPETSHYTHPSGSMPELILQAQPHHLLNHSCEANVVSGLSPAFWEAAAATGRADLQARLTDWSYFADPNSFFLSRDVEAGEELTLDYSLRVAPITAAATSAMATGAFLQVCRCGSPSCRQFIYRARPELHAYIHGSGGGAAQKAGHATCFDVARDLLALGVDDETVLLSLLPSRAPLVAYVHGRPLRDLTQPQLSSTSSAPTAALAATDMQVRKFSKGDVILCYRHVFRDLNEAAPSASSKDGGVP